MCIYETGLCYKKVGDRTAIREELEERMEDYVRFSFFYVCPITESRDLVLHSFF
jgi:hypothetical protein